MNTEGRDLSIARSHYAALYAASDTYLGRIAELEAQLAEADKEREEASGRDWTVAVRRAHQNIDGAEWVGSVALLGLELGLKMLHENLAAANKRVEAAERQAEQRGADAERYWMLLERRERQLADAERALAAYADLNNWNRPYPDSGDAEMVWCGDFGPDLAREALGLPKAGEEKST